MIHAKDHQSGLLFDPLTDFSPRRKRLLQMSWAYAFRREILPVIPVEKLAQDYAPQMSAPTKELYSMVGLVLLQHCFDLTDEETISQLAFNLQWHYALDIAEDSDRTAYVSPRTLRGVGDAMIKKSLHEEIFDRVAQKLARLHKVDTALQRLDSVHLFSNMQYFGRNRLVVVRMQKFLRNLKRQHPEQPRFGGLEQTFTARYLEKTAGACFAMVKPSESLRALQILADDLLTVTQRFREDATVCKMSRYQLLARLLVEQCQVAQMDATGEKVSVKPAKEVRSSSLQNPSDPDAGYDGHKGKGYQAQVCETYGREQDTLSLSLITHIATESADKSDAHALVPTVEATHNRGLGAEQVLAFSLYGSDENLCAAEAKGVELVAPAMGSTPQKALCLADFTQDDAGRISACPHGHSPLSERQNNGSITVAFDAAKRAAWPHLKQCPVKKAKKHFCLKVNAKALRIAKRRAFENTPAFHEIYRFRAGVEATMSEFDRRAGVRSFTRTRASRGVLLCRPQSHRYQPTKGHCVPKPQKTRESSLESTFTNLCASV